MQRILNLPQWLIRVSPPRTEHIRLLLEPSPGPAASGGSVLVPWKVQMLQTFTAQLLNRPSSFSLKALLSSWTLIDVKSWEFPGSSMVETWAFTAKGTGSILVGELNHTSCTARTKKKRCWLLSWKEALLFYFRILLSERVSVSVSAEPPSPGSADQQRWWSHFFLCWLPFCAPPHPIFMVITTRGRGDTVLSEDVFIVFPVGYFSSLFFLKVWKKKNYYSPTL